ncbi:MAG TPA: IPT/TIG domain-containing protein [Streptosporangiaceae bacterium]|jgi:hypothetical protein
MTLSEKRLRRTRLLCAGVVLATVGAGLFPATADASSLATPAPAVTAISPTSGPTAGGTTVTVTGTAFTDATAVTFGAAAATSFTVVSATEITAVSPAQTASVQDIQVTTPGGASPVVTADQFTYAPVPAITAISPKSGPAAGKTTVTITGTAFTGATQVTFGASAAKSFTVVSATEITAVSPAQSPCADNIRVTTPGGTSPVVTADQFTYTGTNMVMCVTAPTITSTSAGAEASYSLSFTTPSNGELASGGTVSVALPTGMTLQNTTGEAIYAGLGNVTYGGGGGYCTNTATILSCTINQTVPAGTALTFDFNAVNPSARTYQLGVLTSADTNTADSPSFKISDVTKVSGVTAPTITSTSAGAEASYSLSFTTSSNGELIYGSTVSVALPTGMTLQNTTGEAIYAGLGNVTYGGGGGYCTNTATILSCSISQTVPAGTALTFDFNAVNPSARAYQLGVFTSSDPVTVDTPSFTITDVTEVSGVTAPTITSTSAGAEASYSVSFTTSSNGELIYGSTVSVALPTGMTLQNTTGEAIYTELGNVTYGGGGGYCTNTATILSCTIGQTVPAGTALTFDFNAVNPAKGTYHLGVFTSSDPVNVASPSFKITDVTSLSGVTAPAISSTSAGAEASYSVIFTTSSNGELIYGSTVSVALPTGMTLQNTSGEAVYAGLGNVTYGGGGGYCTNTVTTLSCPIGQTVPAGTTLSFYFNAVNPKAGTYHLGMFTSSDPVNVASPNFTITDVTKVSDVTAPTISTAAAGADAAYSVSFTTSQNGELIYGSTVSVALPTGMTLQSTSGEAVYAGLGNVTYGGGGGYCTNTVTTLSCPIGQTVPAGTTLTFDFNAVNPPAGSYNLGVFTSSDPVTVNSPRFKITG